MDTIWFFVAMLGLLCLMVGLMGVQYIVHRRSIASELAARGARLRKVSTVWSSGSNFSRTYEVVFEDAHGVLRLEFVKVLGAHEFAWTGSQKPGGDVTHMQH